jgi:hypothetical protein
MAASETAATERALALEWLAVRIVVGGGFAIAILAAIYFGVIFPRFIQPRAERAQLAARIENILRAEVQICSMALDTAKNFGIVPQYGQLASSKLARTSVQGRYVCLAATNAARYVLAVDLLCHNLESSRCTSLYNVSQSDGTILYQRQR